MTAKTISRRTALGYVLTLCLTLICIAEAAVAERLERAVRIDGQRRTYIAHIPDNPSSKAAWPVLVAFHPALADGEFMERTARLHRKAQGRDYIVVYPDGFRTTWNAGDCCGRAEARNINDLGFFKGIMDDLATLVPIEQKAFLTGFSNGAILTYHLACRMPERVAAIAPFGATYSGTNCKPGRVPVFHIHGALDQSAPADGGFTNIRSFDQTRRQVPVRDSVETIGSMNGCSLGSTREWYSKLLKTNCRAYSSCEGGETVMCVVDKLGHTWPGAAAQNSALGRKFGPGRTDIDGSGAVLAFFARQRAR